VSVLQGDDGIERVKSWHNDTLNDGKTHDAFDCYRLLECGGSHSQALNWNSDLTRQNQRDFMKAKDVGRAGEVRGIA
jgi:hypothetical protein